jgi:hypothetical protein
MDLASEAVAAAPVNRPYPVIRTRVTRPAIECQWIEFRTILRFFAVDVERQSGRR